MVQYLEILAAEAGEAGDDLEQIILDAGDWCPAHLARAGDLKEAQGLFDKSVFAMHGKERPEGRYVSMRMIRRWKGEVIKSRLCLQDVAYTKAPGGELLAAKPSSMALRTGLTTASG